MAVQHKYSHFFISYMNRCIGKFSVFHHDKHEKRQHFLTIILSMKNRVFIILSIPMLTLALACISRFCCTYIVRLRQEMDSEQSTIPFAFVLSAFATAARRCSVQTAGRPPSHPLAIAFGSRSIRER